MAKSTKKTKYYTHEEALALILASSEDSEDSQYDSEIEEMFKQQLDEVLDRWVTPSMCIFVCGFLCLLSVHTRSELSDQIAGSHSLSMGKSDQSDQSDQRYQRPKLSDQSVKKKLKTF